MGECPKCGSVAVSIAVDEVVQRNAQQVWGTARCVQGHAWRHTPGLDPDALLLEAYRAMVHDEPMRPEWVDEVGLHLFGSSPQAVG